MVRITFLLAIALVCVSAKASDDACSQALSRLTTVLSSDSRDWSFEPLPVFSPSSTKIEVPGDIPILDESLFSEYKFMNPAEGDGGTCASYRARYGEKTVHLKILDHALSTEAHLREFNIELRYYAEFSRRGLAAPLIGVTRAGAKLVIVSEFVQASGFLKTFNIWPEKRAFSQTAIIEALASCPECRSHWIKNMNAIADFLSENQLSIFDPQFMLLPNGRVYMYDFALMEVDPSGTEAALTHASIKKLAEMIGRQD